MSYDDYKFQQPDDSYFAEQEKETEINEPINPKTMNSLNYFIKNNIQVAENILLEYPNVDYVPFKVTECSYKELKEIAKEYKKEIEIKNGFGIMTLYTGSAFFQFETKPLIVSEPIIVEG